MSELAFFAQDNDGNVWHLGQYREIYDDVELVGGRAWLVGHLEGAKAGIMMEANPQPGKPSYYQGFAPAPFNWTDRARTVQMRQKVTVPAGSYENVLWQVVQVDVCPQRGQGANLAQYAG